MNSLLSGAAAGSAATTVMTVVMKSLHAQLPYEQRHPLPPQRITSRVAQWVGLETKPRLPDQWEWKTYASHYAYGVAGATAYAATARRLHGPPVVKGILFGLAIWAASYLGWLPAAGLHRPATREPTERNLLMIAAHVVWGAVVGIMTERGPAAR